MVDRSRDGSPASRRSKRKGNSQPRGAEANAAPPANSSASRRLVVDEFTIAQLGACSRYAAALRENPKYSKAQFARDQIREGRRGPKTSAQMSNWLREMDNGFGRLLFVTTLKEAGGVVLRNTSDLDEVLAHIDAGKVTDRTAELTAAGRNVVAIAQLLDTLLNISIEGTGQGLFRVLNNLSAAFLADHRRYRAMFGSFGSEATEKDLEMPVFDSDFDDPSEHLEEMFDWTASTHRGE